MVPVSVEGRQESSVGEEGAVGELVAPSAQPPGDEVGGVMEVITALFVGVGYFCDHLNPYQGAEVMALCSRVGGVLLLVTEVKKGSVSIDDVVGEPRIGGEAAECVQADCGVVARVKAVGGGMVPVGADQGKRLPCEWLENGR